jgi:hypothetical protein
LNRSRGISRRELLNRGALALCAAALPSARLPAQATISPVMTTLSGYMAAAKIACCRLKLSKRRSITSWTPSPR